MRTELSASRSTVYFYSGLVIAFGIAIAFIDPLFLVLSAIVLPQGLLGFSFWQVSMDASGFSVTRHGEEQFIPFEQVKSVSTGLFGLPHLVLTLRRESGPKRIRFFPEPSRGGFFFRNYRLKRQLEGIILSAAGGAKETRAA